MLLAPGNFDARDYNFMTVSWGTLGIVWDKRCAMAFVRPSRYTRQFMDKADSFTLSLFPEELHKALVYCGGHSGRQGDKAKAPDSLPFHPRKSPRQASMKRSSSSSAARSTLPIWIPEPFSISRSSPTLPGG